MRLSDAKTDLIHKNLSKFCRLITDEQSEFWIQHM